MLIEPWFASQPWSWIYVQEVWDRWQTFNAAVIAFVSSLVAFNISRYNENKKREREFVAVKALLPHALSELTKYFKESSVFLISVWNQLDENPDSRPILKSELPVLPSTFQPIFTDAIKFAEPDVAEYLANVMRGLQIHNARLLDMRTTLSDPLFTSH